MPGTRKVTDIRAPKHKETLVVVKKKKASGSGLFFFLLFLILGIAALGGFFLIPKALGNAKVTLWPAVRIVSTSFDVVAKTDVQSVDLSANNIPLNIIQTEKELVQVFPSTGKEVTESKAKGTVTVYNSRTVSQLLIANTRFMSESGKLFYSQERVTIPGGRATGGKVTPGSKDISVIAAEAGEEYNIGSSNFSLPGLAGTASYTLIYGKSNQAITGGAREEISVVSSADFERAKESLIALLTQQAKDDLSQKAQGYVILPASLRVDIIDEKPLVKEGVQLDKFSYAAKVAASAYAFSEKDMQELAAFKVREQLSQEESFSPSSLEILYDREKRDEAGKVLSFEATIEGKGYKKIDKELVRASIQGISRSSAEQLLGAQGDIAKANIHLWPFWSQSVPQDKDKITVDLAID